MSAEQVTIVGRKSGKKAPKNEPNTIRTRGRARFVEIISEGPIEGLVNGAQSIYFDKTPLAAPDGTPNFQNVNWEFHKGTADDGYFYGQNAVETPVQVDVQVKNNATPVTRTIVEQNADAVRVIMRVNALFRQSSKGALKKTSLSYAIDVRGNEGTWHEAIRNTINEKSTSPFQIAHRVELPYGGSPWEIRVRRLTADKDPKKDDIQNDLYLESYVILVEGKFIYPHTAAISFDVNAEDMGTSIPPRAYHVLGIQVKVPSNYNNWTRRYDGIWDGSFKIAWTNNPAWIFYDLVTNTEYGLGEFIPANAVDKWSLYTIAQYCDQSVPSGYKNGDTGEDIYEPRFTFNGVINSRDEAYFVLQNITKAWRGMAYWAYGQVFATADMPSDPVKLVTPANVVKGEFEYSGTAVKARHSVVLVKWNDPKDFYSPSTEVVIDNDLLVKYGWREKSLQFPGCTSRGLAHRYGKWIIDSEQHETETVTYKAGWDHANVRPGDIIAVSDPNKANIRAGGRILQQDDLTIELDAPFEAKENQSYQLMLAMPDGSIETRPIAGFLDEKTVRVTSAFSQKAVDNAVWTIKGTDITPRLFRVLDIKEEDKNIFTVSALFHDPQKFDRVERDIVFEPLPYNRPSNTSLPPKNLTVKETGYVSNGHSYQNLTLSWTPPDAFLARGFLVSVDTPDDDHQILGFTQETYKTLNDVRTGKYKFYVQTLSYTGLLSTPAELEYDALGGSGYPLPTVSNIELIDNPGSTTFNGRDLRFRWHNNLAQSMNSAPSDTPSPHYHYNIIKIYNTQTGDLLRQERVNGNAYTYTYEANNGDNEMRGHSGACRSLRVEIVLYDVFGRNSEPGVATFYNPPPEGIAPTYQVNGSVVYMGYDRPKDTDFEGVILFRSETPGIDVNTAEPFYEGTENPIVVMGKPDTTYYFKIAGYDAFGKEDLNYSTEFAIHTLFDIDVTAPKTPKNLAVNSAIIDNRPHVTVKWDENTEDDLAGYDLQLKELPDGNWVSVLSVSNSYEFDTIAGLTYQYRVRARDKLGNVSPYTATVEHKVAVDDVPPEKPTNFHINSGLNALWLSWENPTDVDFSHVEIYEGSTDNVIDAKLIAQTPGITFSRTGLEPLQTLNYWLRAVDTSGNKGEYTDMVTVTTARLPDPKRYQIVGLTLTPNSPDQNDLHWTDCTITYAQPGDAGTTKTIKSDNAKWTADVLYLYYVEGDDNFRTTTNMSRVFLEHGYPIAAYHGDKDIRQTDGKVMIDGASILAETIGSQQLVVNDAVITNSIQIADATVTNAKITDLDASKIKANSVLSDSIKVGDGATLGEMADPANLINSKATTLIDPGRVRISGGTTLNDWRTGGDNTEINGGKIAANTIQANSLVIGSRGIVVDGITFQHNNPSANNVSWTDGVISYTGDNGLVKSVNIAGGSVSWNLQTIYIYWVKNEEFLRTTIDFGVANQDNNVVLATYRGGIYLFAAYGRTIIDGNQISTGTISAEQIKAGAIGSQQIAANAISAEHIAAGAITARHISANQINGDAIIANTLDASKIRAGTITADQIFANSINSRSISNNAITQLLTAETSPSNHGNDIVLSLNVEYGGIVILATVNDGSVPIYRNETYMRSIPINYIRYPNGGSWDGGGSVYYNETSWGTLLWTDYPPLGWTTYRFNVKNCGHVSIMLINFKK